MYIYIYIHVQVHVCYTYTHVCITRAVHLDEAEAWGL